MPITQNKQRVSEILKSMAAEESNRGVFMDHWDDLSQVMLTRREGFTSTTIDGDMRNEDIFDGTPMQSARSLANTVGAMLRPEGEVLAKVAPENKRLLNDSEASAWLADTTARLDAAIRNPKARFRQATGEVDLDLVVFGTGMMFVGLSQSNENLIFQSMHLKDSIPLFDSEGRAVGMYRKRKLKLWQAVKQFGLENLHEDTRKQVKEGKGSDDIEILHAVITRDINPRITGIFAKNMPWADLWIEVDRQHIVKEGGFNEFPFVVPRWDTSSGETYGRSPGMIALPDANTLQAMGETILISGQRAADPPLMAPDDGSFSAVNTFPGGLSYYDVETAAAVNGNPYFSLESGTNLPITRDMQQDTRVQVQNAFFRNILNLPVNGPQMTATEINQRKEEFIREVGAVFGRFESDYNQPMTERAFNVMLRNGGFAPIPESLEGESIKFEFELPVTKIRKQVEAAAAEEWGLKIAQLAQFDPSLRHIINGPELARVMHDAMALPHEIITPRDQFDKKVQAEAEANAKAAQAAELEQMTKSAAQGGKAMESLSKAGSAGGGEGAGNPLEALQGV